MFVKRMLPALPAYIALLLHSSNADYPQADYGAQYYDDATDYTDTWSDDCILDAEGNSFLNGTACDLEVSGDDRMIKYPGGLTGTFRYYGCQNGRPMYKKSTESQQVNDLYLIYSNYWGDWDFCNTTELVDANVVGYGGEGSGESRPEMILPGDWYALKEYTLDVSDRQSAWVSAPALVVKCRDVSQVDATGCSDGIRNNEESGVDCGGPVCNPCVSIEQQEKDYQALKEKLQGERDAKEREEGMGIVSIVGVFFICLIGVAIVCGGPLIYLLKMVKSGSAAKYSAVEMLSNPRKGVHKV